MQPMTINVGQANTPTSENSRNLVMTDTSMNNAVHVPMMINGVPNIPLNLSNCAVPGLPIVVNTNMVPSVGENNGNVDPGNPGIILLNVAPNPVNTVSPALTQIIGNNSPQVTTTSQIINASPTFPVTTTMSNHQLNSATTVHVGQTAVTPSVMSNPMCQVLNANGFINPAVGNVPQAVPVRHLNPSAYMIVPIQNAPNQINLQHHQLQQQPINNQTTQQTGLQQQQIVQVVEHQKLQEENMKLKEKIMELEKKSATGSPNENPAMNSIQPNILVHNSESEKILQTILTRTNATPKGQVCTNSVMQMQHEVPNNVTINSPSVTDKNHLLNSLPYTTLPTVLLPDFNHHVCMDSTISNTVTDQINLNINKVSNISVPLRHDNSMTPNQVAFALQKSNNISTGDISSGLEFLARVSAGKDSINTADLIQDHLSKEDMEIAAQHMTEINNNAVDKVENSKIMSIHEQSMQNVKTEPVKRNMKSKADSSPMALGAPSIKRPKQQCTPDQVSPQLHLKEKRKKGPAPKLMGDEVCSICADKASGFHYNVLSCEGCKGFFRRSVIKGAHTNYSCKEGGGNCAIDLQLRRKCQLCRFQKCKAAGMREEAVVSENQSKDKKSKKEAIERPQGNHYTMEMEETMLTTSQLQVLEVLRQNVRRFEWPTAADVQKVTTWDETEEPSRVRAARFAHFTELSILMVQLVVEFTKQLPGFLSVERVDQIVLLKASAIEVMLLRAAKQYNKKDGTISFLNGRMYDKSSFYNAGIQISFVEPIFEFCESMAKLDLDDAEYAILVAINTFSSDRPHITDTTKVEKMQDPYIELLRVYCKIHRPSDPLMFARILMKLVELRTLNNCHSEQVFALKLQDKRLPPLLAEIWDM